ncbi:GAF domain-containing protein [bacterium]|nr:GAF domain-containing protein [bacterium]
MENLNEVYSSFKDIDELIENDGTVLNKKIDILCELLHVDPFADRTLIISRIFSMLSDDYFEGLSAKMCSIDIIGIEEGNLSYIAMPPYSPGESVAFEYRETVVHSILEKVLSQLTPVIVPSESADENLMNEAAAIFGDNNVILVPVTFTEQIKIVVTLMREKSDGEFQIENAGSIEDNLKHFKTSIEKASDDIDVLFWQCLLPHFERVRWFAQEDKMFSMSEELYSLKFKYEALEKKVKVIESVDKILKPTFSLEEMSTMINTIIKESMSVERVSFLFIDEFRGDLLVKGAVGIGGKGSSGFRLDKRGVVTEHILSIKRVFLCRDMEKELKMKVNTKRGYKTASFIGAPVLVDDVVVAIINVSDKTDMSSFNIDDMERLEILSDKLSIHMKYYKLHNGDEHSPKKGPEVIEL